MKIIKDCDICIHDDLTGDDEPCCRCEDSDRFVPAQPYTTEEYISQLEFDLLEQKKLTDLLFNRCYNLHERLRKLEKENKK